MSELERQHRRAARERAARKEAERLLEEKSREVYQTNQRLRDLAEQTRQNVGEDESQFGNARRQFADDLRSSYDTASSQVRGRLQDGVETLAESGKSLSQEATGMAQRAMDGVSQRATQVNGEIRDRYSRFTQNAQEAAEASTQQWGDEPASAVAESWENTSDQVQEDLRQAGNRMLDQAADTYRDAVDGGSAQLGSFANARPEDWRDQPSTDGVDFEAPSQTNPGSRAQTELGTSPRPRRATQPWRPGSTGSVPEARFESGYQSDPGRDTVQPASYPNPDRTSDRRFSPSYR